MKNIEGFDNFINEKAWIKGSIKQHDDHEETDNYMFFANVSNMKRMCEGILKMDQVMIDNILKNGHGWATDHIATSKDDVEEVYNFLMSIKDLGSNDDDLLSDNQEC